MADSSTAPGPQPLFVDYGATRDKHGRDYTPAERRSGNVLSGLVRAEAANLRARRVQFYRRNGDTIAELAARFRISRRTVFRDLNRDVSDRPEWSPNAPLPFGTASDAQNESAFLLNHPGKTKALTGKTKALTGKTKPIVPFAYSETAGRISTMSSNKASVNNLGVARVRETPTLAEAKAAAIQWAAETNTQLQLAVAAAWECGTALLIVKDQLPHGEFVKWVGTHLTVSIQTARTYMKLATIERRWIGEHRSIRGALASVAEPKKPLPAPTGKAIEHQALVEQTQRAEERASEAEQRVKEKEQVITHYEQGSKVAEGYQAGRSVIEETQQTNSQLRARIATLETEIVDLKRQRLKLNQSNRWLRSQIPKKLSEPGGSRCTPMSPRTIRNSQ